LNRAALHGRFLIGGIELSFLKISRRKIIYIVSLVSGLSKSTTKEKLQEVFGAFGNLKDVRLVTYRNGHSKGLAFVEFTDEVRHLSEHKSWET